MNNYRDYVAGIKEEISYVDDAEVFAKRKEKVEKIIIESSKLFIVVNCTNFVVLAANNELNLVNGLLIGSTVVLNSKLLKFEHKNLERTKEEIKALRLKKERLLKEIPIDVD